MENERFSPELLQAFAEILARHEGDPRGVEREIFGGAHNAPELGVLYERWSRLEDVFGGVSDRSGALESLAASLNAAATDPLLESTLDRLRVRGAARGRYEFRERLGRGGMGVVWRVRDRDLDREVALKLLRGRGGADASCVRAERLLGEARLAARLDHPGIVPVYDVGLDDKGRVYFTMPLVEGESFSALLRKRGAVSHSRALEVLLKVCDTLAYAHVSGIVHRDLKPANVMIGRFGRVHVLDWGLARALEPRRSAHGISGTPAYMSPEQARGEPACAQADVYSCGAMLYEVLTGRNPFADEEIHDFDEMLDRVRARPPRDVLELAPRSDVELAAICRKAMAWTRSERYASAVEFAEDLRAYLDGRVVRAHASGAIAELRKWFGRNRALAVSLSALVACVIAALGTLSWVQSRGKAEVLGFADARRLEELESAARELGPALPGRLEAYRAWLADADALLLRRDTHARRLDAMRRGARSNPSTGEAWTFADAEDRWQHAMLESLVSGLDRFADPVRGRAALVRRRAEFAEDVTRRSLVEHEADWNEAIEAIADRARSPRYKGLTIRPQLGLVPIGTDPRSGLWEFAHLASGAVPTRNAEGTLEIRPDCGLVLVLVPPGNYLMGSQLTPGKEGHDPLARTDEEPRQEVRIEPFFIAKHEITRAQWIRSAGGPSTDSNDALLPAADVSWTEAIETLRGLALDLPTEEQWEYAARAGTTTRWYSGDGPGSLAMNANGSRGIDEHLPAVRVVERPVAVDQLHPNGFGLHNVHGNVAEWTSSPYAPRYGADSPAVTTLRVARGGSYSSVPAEMRSAARAGVAPRTVSPMIGVRPARALDD